MSREMLINVSEGEESRIAIVENGKLEELYVERFSHGSHVGNIYKGKVVNIESGIQAAFIDFGEGKNGFLHISDLHPRYFGGDTSDEELENIGQRQALKKRPSIQQCLRKGQDVIVQITKQGINTKGPTLSTYISLPGKFIVMMPWMQKLGVSHKIEDEAERVRLKDILDQINPPKSFGFIVRTAGQGSTKNDIIKDLKYLLRLWGDIEKRAKREHGTCELYQESDLVIRTIRDIFTSKIDKIICDSDKVCHKIGHFLGLTLPRLRDRITLHEGNIPLFHKYQIEEEIAKIQARTVQLRSGGYIVIEQTEALVAIDVNSGKFTKPQSAEETAFRINMEAAVEIARQLKLRDLGGLIICDFIDMRTEKNRREVETTFREAVKDDRSRSKILKISSFGIIEMTRQRMRPSLQTTTYLACPHCAGSGFIKSHETVSIEVIRMLQLTANKKQIKKIELFVSPEVADYLQNKKRNVIANIEQENGSFISIHSKAEYVADKMELVCYNDRGSVIKL